MASPLIIQCHSQRPRGRANQRLLDLPIVQTYADIVLQSNLIRQKEQEELKEKERKRDEQRKRIQERAAELLREQEETRKRQETLQQKQTYHTLKPTDGLLSRKSNASTTPSSSNSTPTTCTPTATALTCLTGSFKPPTTTKSGVPQIQHTVHQRD
jgi:hypothetical protein